MSTAQRFFTAVLSSGWLALWLGSSHWSGAADSLLWRQNENRVTAEISSWDLPTLLENVAAATGWQIYLEPDTKLSISTKFENRPPGDALRLLLGNLSFALLPQTNAPSQLLVFRTSRQEATQLVRPIAKRSDPTAKPIPNELVVKLKPGAKIDELAKKLGAKVVGRADGLNTYRLSFDSAEATQAAREQLKGDPDVESVDFTRSGLGVAFGVGCGVGCGVGAAATSSTGSSMRAPTDDTLVVLRSPVLLESLFASAGFSESAATSPLLIGSKEPLKRIR